VFREREDHAGDGSALVLVGEVEATDVRSSVTTARVVRIEPGEGLRRGDRLLPRGGTRKLLLCPTGEAGPARTGVARFVTRYLLESLRRVPAFEVEAATPIATGGTSPSAPAYEESCRRAYGGRGTTLAVPTLVSATGGLTLVLALIDPVSGDRHDFFLASIPTGGIPGWSAVIGPGEKAPRDAPPGMSFGGVYSLAAGTVDILPVTGTHTPPLLVALGADTLRTYRYREDFLEQVGAVPLPPTVIAATRYDAAHLEASRGTERADPQVRCRFPVGPVLDVALSGEGLPRFVIAGSSREDSRLAFDRERGFVLRGLPVRPEAVESAEESASGRGSATDRTLAIHNAGFWPAGRKVDEGITRAAAVDSSWTLRLWERSPDGWREFPFRVASETASWDRFRVGEGLAWTAEDRLVICEARPPGDGDRIHVLSISAENGSGAVWSGPQIHGSVYRLAAEDADGDGARDLLVLETLDSGCRLWVYRGKGER
jgi:hypothetical protein